MLLNPGCEDFGANLRSDLDVSRQHLCAFILHSFSNLVSGFLAVNSNGFRQTVQVSVVQPRLPQHSI
jgi:hypothetical protein